MPRGCGDVSEGTVAVVAEELVGEGRVFLGMAVGAVAVIEEVSAERFGRRVPTDVVDDEEVETTVGVEIEPACGDGPHGG